MPPTNVGTQLYAAHHLDCPLVYHLADNLDVGRVDLHVLRYGQTALDIFGPCSIRDTP